MRKIILIACMSKNKAIGNKGNLVINLKGDMQFFKEKTISHSVVMGRKTWDSLPKKHKPLPYRTNYVLSKKENSTIDKVVTDWKNSGRNDNLYVIGGEEIYNKFLDLNLFDEAYITTVNQHIFEADTYFPYQKLLSKTKSMKIIESIKDRYSIIKFYS
tara:strand:+ start:1232 stop:1705 length:474 start_codon:yes stop_codon:yes gene_type:complete